VGGCAGWGGRWFHRAARPLTQPGWEVDTFSVVSWPKNVPALRFASRAGLVAAAVLLQAVVVGLGFVFIIQVTRSGMESRVHERLLEDTVRTARQVLGEVAALPPGPIGRDGPAWRAGQDLVVAASRASDSTVMLLDLQGRVICHPALESNGSIFRLDYAEQRLKLHPDGEVVELGQLRPATPLLGETELLSGTAVVGVVHAPEHHAKVVVIRPAQAIQAAAAGLVGGALRWTAIGGAATLLVTILGSIILVRSYDSGLMRANARLEQELQRRVRRGLAIRNGLIFGLAKLADYRDTDTGKHLERICRYCEVLATELMPRYAEITRDWIDMLKLASSLHDIGKVGVADAILLKPGRLTPEERRVMEMHAVFGADTLVAIRERVGDDDLLNMSVQVALSHHEKWDGTGYPYGLRGEQTPLCARIVALADMYDALTSRRVYKAAMPHEEARRIIRESRGTHFDPDVADAFERAHAAFDAIRAELQPTESELQPALVTAHAMASAAQARSAA
jgi:response regulator RpfG family c-di-GMP phosphodiesterase